MIMGRKSVARAKAVAEREAAISSAVALAVAAKDAEREAAVATAVASAVAAKDAEREVAVAAAVAAAVAETETRMERERKDDLRDAIRLLNQRGLYVLSYKLSCMLSKSAAELVSLVSQVERSHGRARARVRLAAELAGIV